MNQLDTVFYLNQLNKLAISNKENLVISITDDGLVGQPYVKIGEFKYVGIGGFNIEMFAIAYGHAIAYFRLKEYADKKS